MGRIIAGRARGRTLRPPSGKGVRPTADRVRQTLFDILAPRIQGARFLDAFAGSGAVGLEALSRGAEHVVFVDDSRTAVASVRRNLARVPEVADRAEVLCQDAIQALRVLERRGRRFDLVYVDPPYESDLYEPVLRALEGGALLAPGAFVVVEHFHKRELGETIGALRASRVVRVGDHRLVFFTRGQP